MHARRHFVYAVLAEARPLYCPRHAAPSLLIRLMRRFSLLSLTLAGANHYRAPLRCGYAAPRHRRPAGSLAPWPRPAVVTAYGRHAQTRRLVPHSAFSPGPSFRTAPGMVAIPHG